MSKTKHLIDYIYEEFLLTNRTLAWLSDHDLLVEAYDKYLKEKQPKRFATHPKDIVKTCMEAIRRESLKDNPKFVFHGYIKSIGFSSKEYDHPTYKIIKQKRGR